MGHAEMLLAVAGLKPDEVTKRTKKLSEGDWSDFSPAEQVALQFGHRLAKQPSSLTAKDVRGLVDGFGKHRALDLIWYGAWCNYMTRVADAFQLPLERENVFERPKEKGKKDGKDLEEKKKVGEPSSALPK